MEAEAAGRAIRQGGLEIRSGSVIPGIEREGPVFQPDGETVAPPLDPESDLRLLFSEIRVPKEIDQQLFYQQADPIPPRGVQGS
jgi:hypothetical protein